MEYLIDNAALDQVLRLSGASCGAAQAHGLLCGQLSVAGNAAQAEWMGQVLEGADPHGGQLGECETLLGALFEFTYRQFSNRQSEFQLLLPTDVFSATERIAALAEWCEGFLHGLVSSRAAPALKDRLAAEPISEVIQDLLQITRAEADDEEDDETTESSYAELLEYVRVAAQVVYEELAADRSRTLDTAQLH